MQPAEPSRPTLPTVADYRSAAKPSRATPWKVKLIASVLAFLVGVAVGVQVRRAVWPRGISARTYDRITTGMTRDGVERMLGHADDYIEWRIPAAAPPTPGRPAMTGCWESREVIIWVDFDAASHVAGKRFATPNYTYTPRWHCYTTGWQPPDLQEFIADFLRE